MIFLIHALQAMLIAILGSYIASFIVCQDYRARRGISIVTVTQSFCEKCRKPLNTIELFPILGTIINKGKCSVCGYKYPKTSFSLEITYFIISPIIYLDYVLHVSVERTSLIIVIVVLLTYLTLEIINKKEIEL